MRYRIIPVTPFQQNCTLMWDENTNKAAVVDPGGDVNRICNAIVTYKRRMSDIEEVEIILINEEMGF